MKKINKITKASLEIKKNDNQFQSHKLKSVKDSGDYWELEIEDSGLLLSPKILNFTPTTGMVAKFYGKGFGYSVRGIEIDGHIMRYRTPEQAEEDHKKMCEKYDKDKMKAFKKNKKNMDKDYDNLPPIFKQRID